jgi:hypothetical protein
LDDGHVGINDNGFVLHNKKAVRNLVVEEMLDKDVKVT